MGETSRQFRVAHPPDRPVMIYDRDCDFCVRWIRRWQMLTGPFMDYAASQDVAARFPEIPPQAFSEAVQLVEPSGVVSSGAAAAIRSLAHRRGGRVMGWAYNHVPGVAAVAEVTYRFIARRYHCPVRRP